MKRQRTTPLQTRANGTVVRKAPIPAAKLYKTLPELKAVDFANLANLNTSTGFDLLNGIATGADVYQRIARRIRMNSLEIRMKLVSVAALTNTEYAADIGRVALVFDRQTNGAFPVKSDIFRARDASGTLTSTSALTPENFDNRKRFTILRQWTAQLPAYLSPAVAGNRIQNGTPQMYPLRQDNQKMEWTVDLSQMVHYIGSAATISDIESGSLFIVTYSQTNASGNEGWGLLYSARLTYYDI